MSIVLPVISLVLVVVIQTLLQLTSATFSIFYHFALGKYSIKKSDRLALSYIFGVELFTVFMWLLTYFILYAISSNLPNLRQSVAMWILSGIIAALALIFFCFYYRRPTLNRDILPTKVRANNSTALFIPRRFAANLTRHALAIKQPKDAFLLGFFVGVPELLFTLPLYIFATLIMQNSTFLPNTLIIILSVLGTVLPLFIINFAFHSGSNLADIQRARAKMKPALTFILPACYLFLATTIIGIGLLYG
ncbi:hypothetical protein IJ118_01110 [Candidatus Saccharibacteria bacterium]|nr:hypothetical protein [Candidatus Saccharibacteria bacterium]